MNQIKIMIVDKDGKTITKIGSSVAPPKTVYDYSNEEIAAALRDFADMLEYTQSKKNEK